MAVETKEITIETLEGRYEDAKKRLQGMSIQSDDDYRQAAVFAQAIAVSEKELEETEEVKEKKRLYVLYKGYASRESSIAKKLQEVKDILRSHIAAYAIRRGKEATDEATEKAINAAIATGDDSYLDLIIPTTVAVPDVPGITFAKITDFEIEDPEKLPRKYLVPDTKLIRKIVQAKGVTADIPGVKVVKKTQVRVSAT